ncbi:MAG: hypothetical protein L0229_30085 [Blastocatellia bacterium]|nr:hypothetical protein [Blastocatellia bacterium]
MQFTFICTSHGGGFAAVMCGWSSTFRDRPFYHKGLRPAPGVARKSFSEVARQVRDLPHITAA